MKAQLYKLGIVLALAANTAALVGATARFKY